MSGHKTSITIEDAFWDVLKRVAMARQMSVAALVTEIDKSRSDHANLSSALRIYALEAVELRLTVRH